MTDAVRGSRGRLPAGRTAAAATIAVVVLVAGLVWLLWSVTREPSTPAASPEELMVELGSAVRSGDVDRVAGLAYHEVDGYRAASQDLVDQCGGGDFVRSGATVMPDGNVPAAVATIEAPGPCVGKELVLTRVEDGWLVVLGNETDPGSSEITRPT